MEAQYTVDPVKAHEKAFKETFGTILIYGGAYLGPIWLTAFVHIYLSILITLLMATILKCNGDIVIIFESLHFVIFIANEIVACLWYIYKKKEFDNMLGLIGKNFHDYGNTFDAKSLNNVADNLRYSGKQRKRSYCIKYIIMISVMGFFHGIIRPMYEWFSGRYDHIDYSDGIVRPLSIAIWFPFDPYSTLHFYGAFVVEYIGTIVVLLITYCQLIPTISFGEELCSEFEVLGKSLELFDERVKALYKIRYEKVPQKKDYNSLNYELCIQHCLKESAVHHQLLLEYFDDLGQLLLIPLLSGMLATSTMLCLCGILFTIDSVSFGFKVNFFIIIIGEMVYWFALCWYGEKIQEASCIPGNSFYDSNWIQHCKSVKLYFLIIKESSKRPLKLNAGGFLDVTLVTFTDVCRTAYSYFSLLQVLSE